MRRKELLLAICAYVAALVVAYVQQRRCMVILAQLAHLKLSSPHSFREYRSIWYAGEEHCLAC